MASETKLKIVVDAKDNTGNELGGVSNKLGFLQKDVSGLAKVLGGFAVGGAAAVTAFAVSAIKGFGQAQVSMAKVNSTLENTLDAMDEDEWESFNNKVDEITGTFNTQAGVMSYLQDEIAKLSEATVKLGFDDEAAAESIALLFQRTGDLTKATELNNLAMDLARAKSIDLESASNMVGMVLSGNTKILKQYGIEIDETLTPMEQLDELQKKVGGNAAAFANTFPGQMAILSETWSNFKDQIGETLVTALMPYIQAFNGWLQNPDTKKKFDEWTARFKEWADVIIPVLIETFKIWFKVIKEIFDILVKVGDAILAAVSAAQKLVSLVGNKFGGGKAAGGPVSGGTTYLVGEEGPELFTPSTSGAIIPNHQLGGGGGIVVNINGGTYLSEEAAEAIGDMIIQQLGMSNQIT